MPQSKAVKLARVKRQLSGLMDEDSVRQTYAKLGRLGEWALARYLEHKRKLLEELKDLENSN